MQHFNLALRNIGRNRRRTIATVSAIMLCCSGLILFGGYVSCTFRGDETRTVCTIGHLQVFKKGFFEKGAGNPTAFAIDDFEALKQLFSDDPIIKSKLHVITGQLAFGGLVSCYEKDTSASFMGVGVFPDESARLFNWNPYQLTRPFSLAINQQLLGTVPDTAEGDLEGGSLSRGLGRILEIGQGETASVELLAAPRAGGAPNVTTMNVRAVKIRPTKDLDDRLIALNIKHASELLFPGEPVKVTSLLIQLTSSSDVALVTERVKQLLAQHHPELECRTWLELSPFYTQLTVMFGMMFVFMFCIIVVIVIFTIYNTLAMAIVERTHEIGTLRAMGLTQSDIRILFFLEGLFMGILGGALGVLLAVIAGTCINASEIVYMPPTTGFYTKLEVVILRNPVIMLYGFMTSVGTSMISALLPARQAARLSIVEALRRG